MDIPIDYIAWYGAAIATLVLIWDIYKWILSGPKLSVRLIANMESIDDESGLKAIFVEVINSGSADTTITKLVVKRYRKKLDAWLGRKPISQMVILDGVWGPNLPYLIKQGCRWTGGVNQKVLIHKTGHEGVVYCGVHYTHSNKAKLISLKMSELA